MVKGGKAKWIWFSIALIGVLLALAWPQVEEFLVAKGGVCPWPFNLFHKASPSTTSTPSTDQNLKVFTLDELKKYDGTDPELPILLAIGGKVVDVTKGKKFYGVGATYHQFAGTACTRALSLSSLDVKDINDDVSDFDEKQRMELEETKAFYYDKYPIVGILQA